MENTDKKTKKRVTQAAWQEARALMWRYRYRLTLGLAMMVVSRLSGLVLPAMSKHIIDVVVPQGQIDDLIFFAAIGF